MTYLIFLFSCKEQSLNQSANENIFQTILIDSLGIKNLEVYNRVFILTEEGCISCNRNFSKLIQDEVNDSTLCVISAVGTRVDISYFKEESKSNIVFDYDNYFLNNQLLKTSSVAYLKDDGQLDTLIELNTKDLSKQFEWIKTK